MKRYWNFVIALAVLAFAVLCATGIDLINSRTGPGMLLLGGAMALWSVGLFIRPGAMHRPFLTLFTFLAGAFFLWRASAGGPPALAVADAVLVLAGLGIYPALVTTGREVRPLWIAALAVIAGLNALIGIYQKISPDLYYVWQTGEEGYQMIAGLFGHYNAFAAFLNGSIFFFLSYLILGKRTALRVAFAVLALVTVVALVLSGSRGGWLSFVVGGMAWLVFLVANLKQRGSRMVGGVAVAGVLLAVVGGVTSIPVIQKITEERVEANNPGAETREVTLAEADGGRFAFQQMAFEVFLDSPAVGEGPRAFSYRSLEKWDPDSFGLWNALPVFAHNEFLQVLADYGLIGFALVIGLLFLHGILGTLGVLRSDSEDPDLAIWQLGALAGLVAVMCQCFFSFLCHYPACLVLVAFQLGILASRPRSHSERPPKGNVIGGRLAALLGLGVAAALVAFGTPLTQSYLLTREGDEQIVRAHTPEDFERAFETYSEAAQKGWNPDLLEVVARAAMRQGNEAARAGETALARSFFEKTKKALQEALALNPHFGESIAGLPRVEDTLGNYAEAAEGHEKAMEKLWTREISFRPHFQAARSSFFRAFRAEDEAGVLALLRQARERLDRRREILRRSRFLPPVKEFSEEVDAWIAFYEGRRLFIKGDEVWKTARPRNPELAYALFLEAKKRYQSAQDLVAEKDPRWEQDVARLTFNLRTLEGARFQPVSLSDEEIAEFLAPEAGLASDEGSR